MNPSAVTDFRSNLSKVLDDGTFIRWLEHGRSFKIHNRRELVEGLPEHFRLPADFACFSDQLLRHGFQQQSDGQDKGAIYHNDFVRGGTEELFLCSKSEDGTTTMDGESHYSRPMGPEAASGAGCNSIKHMNVEACADDKKKAAKAPQQNAHMHVHSPSPMKNTRQITDTQAMNNMDVVNVTQHIFKKIQEELERQSLTVGPLNQMDDATIARIAQVMIKHIRDNDPRQSLPIVPIAAEAAPEERSMESSQSVDGRPLPRSNGHAFMGQGGTFVSSEGPQTAVKYSMKQGGAKLDAQDKHGSTPLHSAIVEGNLENVKYWLERRGAKVDAQVVDDACKDGHLDVVKYLMEKGGAKEDAQAKDASTPLHYACQEGHLEVVKCLMEKESAKMDGQEDSGLIPLEDPDCSDLDGMSDEFDLSFEMECVSGLRGPRVYVAGQLLRQVLTDQDIKVNRGRTVHGGNLALHVEIKTRVKACKDGGTPYEKLSRKEKIEFNQGILEWCVAGGRKFLDSKHDEENTQTEESTQDERNASYYEVKPRLALRKISALSRRLARKI